MLLANLHQIASLLHVLVTQPLIPGIGSMDSMNMRAMPFFSICQGIHVVFTSLVTSLETAGIALSSPTWATREFLMSVPTMSVSVSRQVDDSKLKQELG